MRDRSQSGFTLAELLIAMVLLSIIAIFTIPKILQAERDSKYNAMAKEALSTVAQTYAAYKLSHEAGPPALSTTPVDLLPYLNYVHANTTPIDDIAGYTSLDCANPQYFCAKMHNGGVLWMDSTNTFGGNSDLDAIYLIFDADGHYGNSTTGDSKSLAIILYYNGRITSGAVLTQGTLINGTPVSAMADPDWFLW